MGCDLRITTHNHKGCVKFVQAYSSNKHCFEFSPEAELARTIFIQFQFQIARTHILCDKMSTKLLRQRVTIAY